MEIKATGDITLHTAGKYCKEDILVKVPSISSDELDAKYAEGYSVGYNVGNTEGHEAGYTEGYEDGASSLSNTLTKIIDRTIVEISDTQLKTVGGFAFRNCFSLESADFPNATEIESYAFNNCYKLLNVNFPKVASVNKNAFQTCSILATVDFPKATSIAADAFSSCPKLAKLILRNTTKVVSLANTSALSGTAIKSGTGFVYVPDELVDSYKSATNWATYASQIKPLSELV